MGLLLKVGKKSSITTHLHIPSINSHIPYTPYELTSVVSKIRLIMNGNSLMDVIALKK